MKTDYAEVEIFHSGTVQVGGGLFSARGRVLTISATGADLEEASNRAYKGAKCIEFKGMQYRTDIGT